MIPIMNALEARYKIISLFLEHRTDTYVIDSDGRSVLVKVALWKNDQGVEAPLSFKTQKSIFRVIGANPRPI